MKYLVSFRTVLRISRYLFRTLALMLWTLGVLLTTFFITGALHEKEAQVRQEFNASHEQLQWYVRHSADVMRELKFITENRLNASASGLDVLSGMHPGKVEQPRFYPLFADSDCSSMSNVWKSSLDSLSYFLDYWKSNFASAYELNQVFFLGGDSSCMADFGVSHTSAEHGRAMKLLSDRIIRYRQSKDDERMKNLYWISPATQTGSGHFYMVAPVYIASKLEALLGTEQQIRLEDIIIPGRLPVVAMVVDQDNQLLLSTVRKGVAEPDFAISDIPDEPAWFGYANNYKQLVMKKSLQPSTLSVVYSIPTSVLIEQFRMMIINALLLNVFSAVVLFSLVFLFERRMFLPAEDNALRLEEHEQFNRKIVASAPVGICILRTSDGTNILSNELAHNYLTLLTPEDRQRLTEIICGKQVNFVDVLTGSKTNLQISFVPSRYRNEDVAICVLVDVSARIKMEESLHEVAQAAEQASQAKSMFLATVSHELRTPLYGIIGNLDLLQTRSLPQGVDSLVTAMNNSSGLLLKIISDILDFSKIESEQLKIEPRPFSPREVIMHIASNYLSLIVKKHLTLYCFIDNDVPLALDGDPLRLQQVISNLLNNAIKFTHTGCIILQAYIKGDYLAFRIRDTGVGIAAKEITRLFDPFFQVGSGIQRNFQGTGLGLAICEKLINMMDGDIEVDSEPGMGSQFIIRIPLYHRQPVTPLSQNGLQDRVAWLALRNDYLADFIERLLILHGMKVRPFDEHRYAAEDVVITDYALALSRPVNAMIEFSGRHIDIPQEVATGRWIYSTATPHELPALLGRIYRVTVDIPDSMVSLDTPAEENCNNEDILVLVVDDHPINRMLLSEQLGSLGYQVKTAQDGVDALNVVSRTSVDIVLTDVNMPNMDGYRLTQRLRQLGQTFPVIGITANALAEEKQRCIESGMDNCLSKPIGLDLLKKTLALYAERIRKNRV